jgi:hypothetical protein
MDNPKRLLVEGHEDLYAVAQLMGHHIDWPDKKENAPVSIVPCGSISELMDLGYLSTLLKASRRVVATLGVLIDADDSIHERWEWFRKAFEIYFPDIPSALPGEGLIADNADGKRLGVWIMPDNCSSGMMETFLRYLVKTEDEPLWTYAKEAFQNAKAIGADCKDVHVDKAHIHTFLAWKDPPGQALGNAIVKKVLDAHSPSAAPFVK